MTSLLTGAPQSLSAARVCSLLLALGLAACASQPPPKPYRLAPLTYPLPLGAKGLDELLALAMARNELTLAYRARAAGAVFAPNRHCPDHNCLISAFNKALRIEPFWRRLSWRRAFTHLVKQAKPSELRYAGVANALLPAIVERGCHFGKEWLCDRDARPLFEAVLQRGIAPDERSGTRPTARELACIRADYHVKRMLGALHPMGTARHKKTIYISTPICPTAARTTYYSTPVPPCTDSGRALGHISRTCGQTHLVWIGRPLALGQRYSDYWLGVRTAAEVQPYAGPRPPPRPSRPVSAAEMKAAKDRADYLHRKALGRPDPRRTPTPTVRSSQVLPLRMDRVEVMGWRVDGSQASRGTALRVKVWRRGKTIVQLRLESYKYSRYFHPGDAGVHRHDRAMCVGRSSWTRFCLRYSTSVSGQTLYFKLPESIEP